MAVRCKSNRAIFSLFFFLLPRGITSGSTSPAQSGSISVLCVRLQSTRRSNIYSNTCVVCKLVVRVRVYGPVAHMHKRRVLHICISLENRARSCAFDAYQGRTIFIPFLRSRLYRVYDSIRFDELLFHTKYYMLVKYF